MENKKWYKSKTIWMAIAGVLLQIINPFLKTKGINIPEEIPTIILGGSVIQSRVSSTPIQKKK
jgi:uncharacterized membrane protein